MTRAAVTKLLLLVILAFIICLPEFFTSYRVSKVNLICLPYRPCRQGNQVKRERDGRTGNAAVKGQDMCDPTQAPYREMWEQACAQDNQTSDGLGKNVSLFVCETDMDMAQMYSNISSSAPEFYLEVSVEIQLSDAETLNLTLYGHSNHSSLRLHPPEEEEVEVEEVEEVAPSREKGDDEGRSEAFFCCLPLLPASESANQSRCLLWLASQTVLTATAKGKLPWKRTEKDEWRCVFRAVWLALLGLVLLTTVTVVIGQIYWGKRLSSKCRLRQAGYNTSVQQLNDREKQTETITPNGREIHSHGFRSWTGTILSPIPEVDSQNDIETLLDGNVDHCYTANLHHRAHSSTSSVTEEQP
ncbi:uncharacterized protein LOC125003426 [Mugil cephalus]|uniref:uncharacterized protein LOC125003426 n=1 Tax=Mugil cephalus TaxID=48193 RepID=UPI001FB6B68B|nr:uncharacterized protein LOC125003426 [Mugil cephalus]